ncbi:MAG: hypothetical protein K8I82_14200, partial [Anaerolineae bacterium]|nr:hypothetical protein [Anaerolineae bacterium]
DGCYLTPNGDHRVFVRSQPDFEAEILGRIIQGAVYEADGFLLIDSEMWFVLTNFPGGTGTPGYVSGSVLNASAGCAEIPQGTDSSINDLTAELCTVVTGFDAGIWASDPAMPSVSYGTFVFAAAPGTSIPAGTQPIAVYNILHNLLQYNYLPENWTAFATDAGLMDAAYNADYAGDYNWPTPNGYLIHENFMTPYAEFVETKFYRLSGEFGGNCGPIMGSIDDLTQGNGTPVAGLDIPPMPAGEYACTITILTGTVFAFNYAPGTLIPHDTAPIAILSNPDIYRPDASIWRATLYQINPNTDYYEYLQYGVKDGNNVWMAAPRTGGTCGSIVNTNFAPQRTETEPTVVRIYAVDPAMFGLLDGVKGDGASINVHN